MMKQQKKPVFIDPTTDVGFKRLFGDKENLKNFLNIIFRGRKDIVDLSYGSTEHVGSAEDIGTVVHGIKAAWSQQAAFYTCQLR